jgi:hypothetical protein
LKKVTGHSLPRLSKTGGLGFGLHLRSKPLTLSSLGPRKHVLVRLVLLLLKINELLRVLREVVFRGLTRPYDIGQPIDVRGLGLGFHLGCKFRLALTLCLCCRSFLCKAVPTLLLHLRCKSCLPVGLDAGVFFRNGFRFLRVAVSALLGHLALKKSLTVGLCLRGCFRNCRSFLCKAVPTLLLHLRCKSCLLVGLCLRGCFRNCRSFLCKAVPTLLLHLRCKSCLLVGLCLRGCGCGVPRCYILGRFCAVLLAVPRERAAGALGRARCGKSLAKRWSIVVVVGAATSVRGTRVSPAHAVVKVEDVGNTVAVAVVKVVGRVVAVVSAVAAVVSAIFQGNSRPKTPALRKRCHFGLSRR